MNYSKIHNAIMNKALTRSNLSGYFEKHHIVPKCLGGLDTKDNIVKLTAKEHYIIHRILTRIYPTNKKIAYAFWRMCNNGAKLASTRAYEEGRKRVSELVAARKGLFRGRRHSEEMKRLISESIKKTKATIPNASLGRKHTNVEIEKMRVAAKSKVIDPEVEKLRIERIVKAHTGRRCSEQMRKNMSEGRKKANLLKNKKHWTLINGKRVYT